MVVRGLEEAYAELMFGDAPLLMASTYYSIREARTEPLIVRPLIYLASVSLKTLCFRILAFFLN